jgi:hypothetical protein
VDIVREVTEFIKDKGNASQKAMVALQAGWKKQEAESSLFQGILNHGNLWVGKDLGRSGGWG